MFISSFWSKSLSLSFLPVTVGSLYIFLYFTLHSLHFFLYFVTIFNQSWLPVFWTAHLIGWLSLCCLVIFYLELWSVLSFGPYFLSQHTCYVKRDGALGICQGGTTHFAVLCCMWGRRTERKNVACWCLSWFSFTSPATHKQIGADSQVGGFVYILGPCGSLQQTVPWSWEFLPLPQPPQNFSVRGFEALFPCTGTLGSIVCLAPQLFLPVYPHTNVGLPCPPAATLLWALSTQLPISAPPTSLDECFFFNSLVVRLPYSSIFCQFWLVFVFKFVVVLLLVLRRGTVCLPTPPSWAEVSSVDLSCQKELPTCR